METFGRKVLCVPVEPERTIFEGRFLLFLAIGKGHVFFSNHLD